MKKKPEPMKVGKATLTPLPDNKVKITLGGKSTEVEYKDLWGPVFMLGNDEYRDNMIPVRKTEMMIFSRKHVIRAEKDIKAGETLNVWCEVNIPKTVVEAIAEENGAKVIYQVIPKAESSPTVNKKKKELE